MAHLDGVAPIAQRRRHPGPPIRRCQQRDSGVGGEIAPVKPRQHVAGRDVLAPGDSRKRQRQRRSLHLEHPYFMHNPG
jgi:hypothetical protein